MNAEELKKLHLAEEAIRESIATERHWLNFRMTEHKAAEQALLAREAGVREAAAEMVESERVNKLHQVNVALAERIARFRISGDVDHEAPSPEAVQEALNYWGATSDVFRLCWATTERPVSDVALVLLHTQATTSAEQSAVRAAREAAISKMVSEQRDVDYAAQVAQQNRLEA